MELIVLLIFVVIFGYVIYSTKKPDKPSPLIDTLTNERIKQLEYKVNDIPRQVMESINGTISFQKGKLAELAAYMNLRGAYDKVIPLNNIVDFICIRFPKDADPGTVDFIDIKNGKSARLSDDQKKLSVLIHNQHINFLKVKIDTSSVQDITNAGSNTEL